jgi:hypothetical protein
MEKIYDLKVSATEIEKLDLSAILDEEKILHLHPHWTVEEQEVQDRNVSVLLQDYETDDEFRLGLRLDFNSSAAKDTEDRQTVMCITLFDFAVEKILFFTEQDRMRVKISGSGDTIDEEVEKSIFLWVRSIQEYMRLYTSSRPTVLFFRLIMNRMILRMNPSQRKICVMITKITLVEVLVIVIIVVGYFFFVQ